MNRTQRLLLGVLAVVAVGIGVLALRNRQPPRLPANETHRSASLTACQACHDPDGVLPRSPNHPLGADCLRCHGVR